jgi:hypothetical protein
MLVGVLGFVPGLAQHNADMKPIMIETFHGKMLGLFPINVLHNVVHMAIGAWGILASKSVSASRLFGKGLAVFFGLLAILGLIPGTNTMFGLVPIYGHDVWLHGLSALIAAYFGFVARESD